MTDLDPAGEWRELSERYRGMSDEELVVLARQSPELTDIAQQALTQEISYRKLKLPPEKLPLRLIMSRILNPPTPKTANWSNSAQCGACGMRFNCRRCWIGQGFRFSWDRRGLRAWIR